MNVLQRRVLSAVVIVTLIVMMTIVGYLWLHRVGRYSVTMLDQRSFAFVDTATGLFWIYREQYDAQLRQQVYRATQYDPPTSMKTRAAAPDDSYP